MGKKIPLKIDDTIAYSILEIRFDLSINHKFLIGKIMPVLIKDFPTFEPINQEIPPVLREQHARFKFIPEFRFSNDQFLIAIGKNVIQFEFMREYKSWHEFGDCIRCNLKKIFGLGVIKSILRIGLRYSNIIKEESIKNVVDLNFDLPFQLESNLETINVNKRFEFASDELKVNLVFATNAQIDRKLVNYQVRGLLIDVDIFKDHDLLNELDSTLELIEALHEKEKFVFFNSLKQKFIDSRNPRYE